MSTETQNRLRSVEDMLARIKNATRFEEQERRLEDLEKKIGRDGFWNDQEAARTVIGDLKRTKAIVNDIRTLDASWHDASTLLELAVEENDTGSLSEAEEESKRLLAEAEDLELRTLLSEIYDSNSCFLSIQAGAGGTDACDWVSILKRMYLRWAERHRYKTRLLEELPEEEAGLRSVTFIACARLACCDRSFWH